jgi:phage terminase small subunit
MPNLLHIAMFAKLLEGIAPSDWIALTIYVAGWSVYGNYVDHRTRGMGALRALPD